MQKLIILQREIKNLKLEFYKEDKKKELKNKKRRAKSSEYYKLRINPKLIEINKN